MDARRPWLRLPLLLPVALALVSLAVAAGGEAARLALRWERSGIAAGEWWRLVTGQFAHLGTGHLVLNLVGLALVWALVADGLRTWRGSLACVLGLAAVGLGLWWGEPGLGWYVGLSGLLHGLLLAGLIAARDWGARERALLLAAVAGKLAWEVWVGPLPGTADLAGGPVISAAHLYGAGGGVVAGLLGRGWRRGMPV